jgi:hypothetical protein
MKQKYPTRVVRFKHRPDNPITYHKFPIKTVIGLVKGGAMNNLKQEAGIMLTIWNKSRFPGNEIRPCFYPRYQIIGEIEVLSPHEELIWRIENDV